MNSCGVLNGTGAISSDSGGRPGARLSETRPPGPCRNRGSAHGGLGAAHRHLGSAAGAFGDNGVTQPSEVGNQHGDSGRDAPPGQDRESGECREDDHERQRREERQTANATSRHTGQGVEDGRRAHRDRSALRHTRLRGLGSLHDNLRTGGTRGTDGVRTWLGQRQIGRRQRSATLQHPHGFGEPVDRPGRCQVFATAYPVLEQVGSPNRDEDEEDQAAGLHKPKVRGVCRPYSGPSSVCR